MSVNNIDSGIRANDAAFNDARETPADANSSDAMLFKDLLPGGQQLPTNLGMDMDMGIGMDAGEVVDHNNFPDSFLNDGILKTHDLVGTAEDAARELIGFGHPEYSGPVSASDSYNAFMFSDDIRYNFETGTVQVLAQRVEGGIAWQNIDDVRPEVAASAHDNLATMLAEVPRPPSQSPDGTGGGDKHDVPIPNLDFPATTMTRNDGSQLPEQQADGGTVFNLTNEPDKEINEHAITAEQVQAILEEANLEEINPPQTESAAVDNEVEDPLSEFDHDPSDIPDTAPNSPGMRPDLTLEQNIDMIQRTESVIQGDTEAEDIHIHQTTYPDGSVRTQHINADGAELYHQWDDGPTGLSTDVRAESMAEDILGPDATDEAIKELADLISGDDKYDPDAVDPARIPEPVNGPPANGPENQPDNQTPDQEPVVLGPVTVPEPEVLPGPFTQPPADPLDPLNGLTDSPVIVSDPEPAPAPVVTTTTPNSQDYDNNTTETETETETGTGGESNPGEERY